jgi:hypothetical protein
MRDEIHATVGGFNVTQAPVFLNGSVSICITYLERINMNNVREANNTSIPANINLRLHLRLLFASSPSCTVERIVRPDMKTSNSGSPTVRRGEESE